MKYIFFVNHGDYDRKTHHLISVGVNRMGTDAKIIAAHEFERPVIVACPYSRIKESIAILNARIKSSDIVYTIGADFADQNSKEFERYGSNLLQQMIHEAEQIEADAIILVSNGVSLHYTLPETMKHYLPDVPFDKNKFYFSYGDLAIINLEREDVQLFKK